MEMATTKLLWKCTSIRAYLTLTHQLTIEQYVAKKQWTVIQIDTKIREDSIVLEILVLKIYTHLVQRISTLYIHRVFSWSRF